jgi:hypothetical protein
MNMRMRGRMPRAHHIGTDAACADAAPKNPNRQTVGR